MKGEMVVVKKLDLTGQRFGRLVVIRDNGERQGTYIMWECLCDCGSVKNVRSGHLKSGAIVSCGCLSREKASLSIKVNQLKSPTLSDEKLLSGKVFGRLKVIEPTGELDSCNRRIYRCKCECGNEKNILGCSIKNGSTMSCGCLHKEVSKIKAETILLDIKKNDIKEGTSIFRIGMEKTQKNNKSGFTGVFWNKKTEKWDANIGIKGKQKNLGGFKNKQDAINARLEAEEKYFKPILEKYGVENTLEELEV